MFLPDANVLLYAVNSDAQHHPASLTWLDGALSGGSTVALSWVALLAFIRLATKPQIFTNPLTVDEAHDRVDAWLASAAAVQVGPSPTHSQLMRRVLAPLGTGANLTNDAHLAALAIAHDAMVVTYDKDFKRFEGVRSATPAELLGI